MNGVALLIQLALINQLRATADVNPEEDEAMNKLMDTLMDDEKNDELVDMIAAKLVDNLLGFNMAAMGTMPQAAMMNPVPMAQVRNLQNPQPFTSKTAPDLQINVAAAAPGKINPDKDGGRTEFNWGTKNRIPKGGVNPYASIVDYPDVTPAKQDNPLESIPAQDGTFKGPTGDSKGAAGFTTVSKLKFPGKTGAERTAIKDLVTREKEFDIRENAGLDVTPERYQRPSAAKNTNVRLEEYSGEEPDAITVLAVGIASACMGSAATFVLFHLHQSLTKAGNTMRAPLLK